MASATVLDATLLDTTNMSDTGAYRTVERLGLFLSHHFGDGLVYLTDHQDRDLLREAIDLGLVSDDGYLTNRGYAFWRRYDA